MSENQNPETCNHNCESCSANCSSRGQASFKIEANPRSTIRHMIGIVSGKGGVGKSFITSLLASEMQRRGYRAAVLEKGCRGWYSDLSCSYRKRYAGHVHKYAVGQR